MKKEGLLSKWLNHNLSNDELKAFKKLNAFAVYLKLDAAAKQLKSPDLDTQSLLNRINTTINTPQDTSVRYIQMPWVKLAASLLILITLGFGLQWSLTQNSAAFYFSDRGEHLSITLPNQSRVQLNPASFLSFHPKAWENKRYVNLKGDAFFNVTSGAPFRVETPKGIIDVIGTQFSVRSWDGLQVVCYEGKVNVTYKDQHFELTKGYALDTQTNTVVYTVQDLEEKNQTRFNSTKIQSVFKEIERLYNVQISYPALDKNTIFTGSITHDNLHTALRAVCIPLTFTFEVDGMRVLLKK